MSLQAKLEMDLGQFVCCRVTQRYEDFQGLSVECAVFCLTVRPSMTQHSQVVLFCLILNRFESIASPDCSSSSWRLRALLMLCSVT